MNNKQLLKEKIPKKNFLTKKWQLVKAISLGLSLVTLSGAAYAGEWNHLNSYNSSTGVPSPMVNKVIPSTMLTRVRTLLPESNREAHKTLLTDDLGANIFLKKDAKVTVAFVEEGAGYLNSIGFFKFTPMQYNQGFTPDDKIIFPNFSKSGSGGYLVPGNAVELGTISAGTAVGFTVVSDGFKSGKVNPNQSTNYIFRTIKKLNPELSPKNAHTVLLSSPSDGMLVLGIEDLNRETQSSDDDFNDAILAIFVEPFDAVDTCNTVDMNTGLISSTCGGGGGGGGGAGNGLNPPASGVGVNGRVNWKEITTPSTK